MDACPRAIAWIACAWLVLVPAATSQAHSGDADRAALDAVSGPAAQDVTADDAGAQGTVADAAAPRPVPDDFEPPPFPEDAPFLHKGLVVGSWVPVDPDGFRHPWVDETGLRQTFTKWKAGRRSWSGMLSDGPRLPLDVLIRDRQGPAVGYLFSLVQRRNADPMSTEVPPDRPAVLHVRHRGRISGWFDGEWILDAPAPPAGRTGLIQVPVQLTHGYDVLLLKVGRGSDDLGPSMEVEVRLSDLEGAPIPHQGWNTMRTSEIPSDLDAAGIEQGRRGDG